jgi:hypothetical protein
MPSKQATVSTVTEIVFWFVSQREGALGYSISLCAARATSREAAPERSLSLVLWKRVTKFPNLFAEDENTRLPGKANFPDLPVFAD